MVYTYGSDIRRSVSFMIRLGNAISTSASVLVAAEQHSQEIEVPHYPGFDFLR